MQSRNICIIPARGGSKRIPRKNVKNFLGKPIIAYSISEALNSGLFEEVMVSTDDNEIANIAIELGASVPFLRSLNNSNDFATTADVILEVISKYFEQGFIFDHICCCYPTAPFISISRLIEGFELLKLDQVDTVFPITSFDYNIWRSFKENSNGYLSFNWSEFENTRSQDLPAAFHDAGQWYWIKRNSFLKHKKMITPYSKGIILSSLEVQDIDDIHDWKIAEIKYEYLQSIK
jgi:N-acylneuraminate cytidylyltransferase